MEIATYTILGAAIILMGIAMVCAFQLRTIAKGGKIGSSVRFLMGFIVLFFVAYLSTPFILQATGEYALLLSAGVFLLGAIFVIIVLRIIKTLIRRVFQELDI